MGRSPLPIHGEAPAGGDRTVPPAALGMETGVVLAVCDAGAGAQLRVRQVGGAAESTIEVRLWRMVGGRWKPGEGVMLAPEMLPRMRRAIVEAERALAGGTVRVPSGPAAVGDRIRVLARQVARAREKLEALRPDDYKRPQDFRRARTIRILELRRAEKLLREAGERYCANQDP